MKLQLTPTLRAPSLVLCTSLLAACSSQLTEPVKAVKSSYTTPSAMANTPPPYSSVEYGVPAAERVDFSTSVQKPVQDMTF